MRSDGEDWAWDGKDPTLDGLLEHEFDCGGLGPSFLPSGSGEEETDDAWVDAAAAKSDLVGDMPGLREQAV